MNPQNQGTFSDVQLAAIYRALSPERMATYFVSAGCDQVRAMRLYIWNARMGEAFYLSIQGVEVGLRNCVNEALTAQFGLNWWAEAKFKELIDHDRTDDLATVKRRIRNRGLQESNGQIVAGLSFGFWVGMLQPRYNIEIWSRQLRTAFPELPEGRSRKSVATSAGRIAHLRNRISHHEPIFKRDLSDDYRVVQEMLSWISSHKLQWIQQYCRIPALLREKP